MAILKAITAPNGAAVAYHRVTQVEGTLPDLVLAVHGWPDHEAFVAGKPPLFVHRVPFDGSALMAVAEAAVLADERFAGGAAEPEAASDVDIARVRRWAAIKATRQALDDAPVAHGDFEVDANASSRSDIMGAIMAMQLNGQTTRPWRCSDNVMRVLTLGDLVAIGTAIADRRQHLIEISDALWQQLVAAVDVAQVEAVVWPVPDPEPEPAPS